MRVTTNHSPWSGPPSDLAGTFINRNTCQDLLPKAGFCCGESASPPPWCPIVSVGRPSFRRVRPSLWWWWRHQSLEEVFTNAVNIKSKHQGVPISKCRLVAESGRHSQSHRQALSSGISIQVKLMWSGDCLRVHACAWMGSNRPCVPSLSSFAIDVLPSKFIS